MANIKELVQKEAEAFEKAQKLKRSAEKVAENIDAIHEIAKQAKKTT